MRDPADGFFNGVLCNDTTGRCAGPKSTGIGQQAKIILSGSNPSITQTAGTATMGLSAVQTLTYWVRDVNLNVMPGGTTVTLSVSGGGLAVSAPSAFAVPCSAQAAGVQFSGTTLFSYGLTSSTTAGSGRHADGQGAQRPYNYILYNSHGSIGSRVGSPERKPAAIGRPVCL